MKKAIILLVVISILLISAVTIFALTGTLWKLNENLAPQPPTLHMLPGSQNVTGTVEGNEAANIALNNTQVQQWTDKGYQLYGVFKSDSIYWVGLLTNEQRLPWVVGISLNIPVQFNSSDPIYVNFELTLANLTQAEKEQTLNVAKNTIKSSNGSASIEDVSVRYWQDSIGGQTSFHAYPSVSFRVPENPQLSGADITVYVDLQNGQVAKVWSNPSKPLPSP
jgi:hypothetical protein